MKKKQKKIYLQLKKRYLKKIVGTEERPRLSVFRSHKHIYAQIINDRQAETCCAASTLNQYLFKEKNLQKPRDLAFEIGKRIATLALKKNIKYVVFDSGSKLYHGRIKSLAEGARLAGLIF